MFRALARAQLRQPPSADVVDLAEERRLRAHAGAAVEAMSAFRAGRAPFTAVLAALIAPFN